MSLWMLPYSEKGLEGGRCVIGSTDPAMRKHLGPEVLSFSMAADRCLEMMRNIEGSFLESTAWQGLVKERNPSME
jgi:hypothetical protein